MIDPILLHQTKNKGQEKEQEGNFLTKCEGCKGRGWYTSFNKEHQCWEMHENCEACGGMGKLVIVPNVWTKWLAEREQAEASE